MITKDVEVTQTIRVTVDETILNDEYNKLFSDTFFYVDCIDDHIKHLAQLKARGFIDFDDSFVEGYGSIKEQNINVEEIDIDVELIEEYGG